MASPACQQVKTENALDWHLAVCRLWSIACWVWPLPWGFSRWVAKFRSRWHNYNINRTPWNFWAMTWRCYNLGYHRLITISDHFTGGFMHAKIIPISYLSWYPFVKIIDYHSAIMWPCRIGYFMWVEIQQQICHAKGKFCLTPCFQDHLPTDRVAPADLLLAGRTPARGTHSSSQPGRRQVPRGP